MAPKQHGVFKRAGHARRIAYSPAEAVQLEYDGWTRIADTLKPTPKPAAKPTPPAPAGAEATPAKASTRK
jgi:hypothetical protein